MSMPLSDPPAMPDLEELSVNEIISRYPATVAVFNHFEVDACCGGSAILEEAAVRDRAPFSDLLAALHAAIAGER